MISSRLGLKVIVLTGVGALGGVSAARADDSMVRQAADELQQAESTSNLDQQAHLKSALGLLDHLPPGYDRHSRGKAIGNIKAALFEAGQGDPNGKVMQYIHDAEDALKNLED
jgi:hypothetical protein